MFTRALVLRYPRLESKFILGTDTYNTAIGDALHHVQDEKEGVIGFLSKVLLKPEQNYCVR